MSRGQTRRGSGTPYFEHVAAVALILDRAGFDEDVVIAGLLHDVVEDTAATLRRRGGAVRAGGGRDRAALLRGEERRRTARSGPGSTASATTSRPLADAPPAARAVILADKLHNLISIEVDLREGRPVWSQFHAERGRSSGTTTPRSTPAARRRSRGSKHLAAGCRDAARVPRSLTRVLLRCRSRPELQRRAIACARPDPRTQSVGRGNFFGLAVDRDGEDG